jgi:hypothetical protein
MSFVDTAGLEQELATNLRHGRAFVQGATGIVVLSDCTLVLVRADGAELPVTAQAVMVCDAGTMVGVGLELRPFGPEVVAGLEAFARGEGQARAPEQEHVEVHADELTEVEPGARDEVQRDEEQLDEAEHDEVQHDEEQAHDELEGRESARPVDQQAQQARHERLRKISQVEQQKIARSGELSDRVMLERLYGKAVWEGLLHNPRLTVPEVARLANKGTMPRPMLDYILDNASWCAQGAVRRALLGNPRVSSEGVIKILRAMPKHELKAMTKSTAYSAAVREQARKLLKV